MKARIMTYNIRIDSTTKLWKDCLGGLGWTIDKKGASRFSGQEGERLLSLLKSEYPNALLEAASKRL